MTRKLRIAVSVFFGVLTVAGMIVGGLAAFYVASVILMSLGLKYHDNYEYYGLRSTICLVYLAGALGFVTPGLVAWWPLMDRPAFNVPRFSLRTLLIATTLMAVVLGIAVWAGRS